MTDIKPEPLPEFFKHFMDLGDVYIEQTYKPESEDYAKEATIHFVSGGVQNSIVGISLEHLEALADMMHDAASQMNNYLYLKEKQNES